MLRSVAALVLVAFASVLVLDASQSRDNGQPATPAKAPPGTAVLSGLLVTDTASPQPIRRASIRLSGAAGVTGRLIGTDDEGKFVFGALPAGSYSVSAAKAGYVETYFGSKHPGRGPGVPVAVADGQRVTVTIKMLPGAVITGTVTDPRGNPAAGIGVQAFDTRLSPAKAAAPARATTDDRGVFRMFGLPPGEYVVSAVPRLGPANGAVAITDAEVQWARGAAGVPPPSGRASAYAPVYYPGGADPSAAVAVALTAGEERAGVDLPLRVVAVARLSGTIVDSAGQSVSPATVTLSPRRTDRPTVADRLMVSGALVLPKAAFTAQGFSISGVMPGEYTLVARSGADTRGSGPASPSAPATMWNVTDITVTGEDQAGLVLRLQPGTRISGTIVFEQSSLPTPNQMSGVEITLSSTRLPIGASASPKAIVDPAATFRFSSVVPSTYAFKAVWLPASPASNWTLQSAILNGRDLSDGLLDVKSGDEIAGLVVTFTDRGAGVSGRLVDAGGRPITQYAVVVFTTDKAFWTAGARRIRAAAPATDGSFSVTGLPPGTYAIAAAEDVEASDLADPDFLSQLLASATYTVTLAAGERITRDLKIGG